VSARRAEAQPACACRGTGVVLIEGPCDAAPAEAPCICLSGISLRVDPDEARDVHHALSIVVRLLGQVDPGPGAALTKAAIPRLELVARRLDHERHHHGAVPNPNGPSRSAGGAR
jgi:hypothetical protein